MAVSAPDIVRFFIEVLSNLGAVGVTLMITDMHVLGTAADTGSNPFAVNVLGLAAPANMDVLIPFIAAVDAGPLMLLSVDLDGSAGAVGVVRMTGQRIIHHGTTLRTGGVILIAALCSMTFKPGDTAVIAADIMVVLVMLECILEIAMTIPFLIVAVPAAENVLITLHFIIPADIIMAKVVPYFQLAGNLLSAAVTGRFIALFCTAVMTMGAFIFDRSAGAGYHAIFVRGFLNDAVMNDFAVYIGCAAVPAETNVGAVNGMHLSPCITANIARDRMFIPVSIDCFVDQSTMVHMQSNLHIHSTAIDAAAILVISAAHAPMAFIPALAAFVADDTMLFVGQLFVVHLELMLFFLGAVPAETDMNLFFQLFIPAGGIMLIVVPYVVAAFCDFYATAATGQDFFVKAGAVHTVAAFPNLLAAIADGLALVFICIHNMPRML